MRNNSKLIEAPNRIRWFAKSVAIFFALILYLVLVKVVITFFPAVFRSTAQAAVFEWKFLGVWALLGWIGVVLSGITQFPEPWNGGISNKRRLLLAIGIGFGLGIVAIATDSLTGWTQFLAAKMRLKTIHIDFPASILIYPGGAIIVNILYRIFPIPLLLWLISTLILKGRHQGRVFWILTIALSLAEPLGNLGLRELGYLTVFALSIQDYALNFLESWLFRMYGFLTPILMRISFYLIWHVLWGLTS